MEFFTNVIQTKNKMLVRGIEQGKPVKKVIDYKPYLFIKAKQQSKYKTTDGDTVSKIDFSSISEARDFVSQYKEVDGMPIFGMPNFLYTYIFDAFRGEIKYDSSLISVCSLDIETRVGEEDIATAIQTTPNEVTAITISRNGKMATFGCGDYTTDDPNITYFRCKDEKHLLISFLEIWNSIEYRPDVVTGWNVEFFDIPYLVGRIIKILGNEAVKKLSPWGLIRDYEVEIKGKRVTSYELKGLTILDYLALYKKFTYSNQESYRLDHIAAVELGEKKLDYRDHGYTGLNDLYDRNYQMFIDYNIHDVRLVDMLEDKMKLIELVFAMAYDAKVNYADTLASVKPWEVIIHNYLMERNIVVPQKKNNIMSDLVGGYVKDVQTGMHKWVVSFDLNSLYPHLIQQYNISPEMFVERVPFPTIDQLLDETYDLDLNPNYSYAANGCAYSKSKQGFLAAIMEKMYNDRSLYKKQMLQVKQEYETTKDKNLLKEISRLDNLQMAKKIQLNSAYGALGNRYFTWFDINHAEAITMSGQLSIRWIGDQMNNYLNKICKTEGVDYILASDTDSIYVNLGALVDVVFKDKSDTKKVVEWIDKVCSEKLEPFIDACYQQLSDRMNAFSQQMHMKRECIADKAIWTAKKRYIMNVWNSEGVAYDKPKLKMTGIEAVKSSTPMACRNKIKSCLEMVMNKDESELQDFILDFKEEFKTLPFEQIAAPRGVSSLTDYTSSDGSHMKGTPIHAKGSILYNKLLKRHKLTGKYEQISNGDKIKFCYLKLPNPYFSNVISSPGELPNEFDIKKYIDYDVQFNKTFIDPLSIILTSIGWNAEKKSTLDSFFG